ncbi:MAG TPA: cupin domain-containing protein [Candidatus Methylomirabilis sp.]|nr:cupin domain-containing protein [Candidatus Methylomirabilis sp.]HSC71347.1 cupin domain-containing protein [Candidatus Methylomirabilis sp.]
MKAATAKRVVQVERTPRYEAPAPYRRFAQSLVDQESFPDTSMCVGFFTYPPGAKSHTHLHTAENEIYFVLEGELTSVQDGRPYRVPRHALVFIPKGVSHHAANRTRRRCIFLAVHAPAVPDLLEFKRTWKRIAARRS